MKTQVGAGLFSDWGSGFWLTLLSLFNLETSKANRTGCKRCLYSRLSYRPGSSLVGPTVDFHLRNACAGASIITRNGSSSG